MLVDVVGLTTIAALGLLLLRRQSASLGAAEDHPEDHPGGHLGIALVLLLAAASGPVLRALVLRGGRTPSAYHDAAVGIAVVASIVAVNGVALTWVYHGPRWLLLLVAVLVGSLGVLADLTQIHALGALEPVHRETAYALPFLLPLTWPLLLVTLLTLLTALAAAPARIRARSSLAPRSQPVR